MVTYKQIGLKHSLSRAYVCIYIDWLCIDIFIFLPIPMASVKWWYSWEEANSLEFLVGWSDQHGSQAPSSFQKLWKFWRCKFVPFQYFFLGYFWGSISATTRQRRWQIHRPEGGVAMWHSLHLTILIAWAVVITGRSKLPIFRPWIPNGRWTQVMEVSWSKSPTKSPKTHDNLI